MSSVSSEAMRLIDVYEWPGNIRQLENLIGQIVITNNESEITPEMLPSEIRKGTHRVSTSFNSQSGTEPHKTIPSIEQMERSLILEALELTSGSVPNAAKQLGLSEATLYRKIKKFGIARTFTN